VHSEEASGSVKNGEVFDLMSNCSFLKKELLDYIKVYLRIVSLYVPKCVVIAVHKTSLYCSCNFGSCIECYCNCLQVLKHAENSYRPQRSHICEINVQGCLADGTVVDAHDHLTVQIGDTEVSVVHRNTCGYHDA